MFIIYDPNYELQPTNTHGESTSNYKVAEKEGTYSPTDCIIKGGLHTSDNSFPNSRNYFFKALDHFCS